MPDRKHLNFYDAWTSLLTQVMATGERCAPRGMPIIECLHTQLVVEDMLNNIIVHPLRDVNYRFMVAEWLWIEAGRSDVAFLAKYNKGIAQFSDDGESFAGAYGPRLSSQWEYLIQTLRRDPDSRQAVATIFSPAPGPTKDVPCTLSLQCFIRNKVLHGIVNMRSQDLWLGLVYDFFNFSMICNGIAGELGVKPGSLTYNAGSGHIYGRDIEAVRQVLDNLSLGSHLRSPRLSGQPRAEYLCLTAEGSPAAPHLYPREILTQQEYLYLTTLQCHTKLEALDHLVAASFARTNVTSTPTAIAV